ncbi:hypothetical protein HG531_011649 [Fusarium graminearum]|nr:hypothetical protein HG531_011649 [Fusarium graminearum]
MTSSQSISSSADTATHYQVLNITSALLDTQHDSTPLIKRAYHRALLRNHPDKVANSDPSSVFFTVDQITTALNVLSSPSARVAYDAALRVSRPTGAAGRDGSFQTGVENVDLDDLAFDEDQECWYRPCRCGNEHSYEFREADLEEPWAPQPRQGQQGRPQRWQQQGHPPWEPQPDQQRRSRPRKRSRESVTVRTSDGIIEGLLSQVASLVRSVEDLVVENGEVEGETKADGVGGRKLGLSNLSSSLVGLEGLVGRVLATVANGELGEVTVVVTLPAELVNNGLRMDTSRLGRGDQVLVKDLEDIFADLGKLGLNLLSVLLDEGNLARVAL